MLPKMTAGLTGSIHAERKRCGRPNCRCARGRMHGPYSYLYWREDGRLRKRYIRAADTRCIRAAVAGANWLRPRPWRVRRAQAELRCYEGEE